MQEVQPIGLSATIKDLEEVVRTQPQNLGEVGKRRVVFPANVDRAEVEVKNLNLQGKTPDYYLRLSAYFTLPKEELEAILQEALGRGKGLRLPQGQYEARLKQTWTTQDFNAEFGLPSFWRSKTSVTSYATIINPDNVRMLGAKSTHRAEVELERNTMTIEADGKYRRHFRDIAGALEPQIATIRLSEEDAERVMALSQQSAISRLLAGQVRKQLRPQKRTVLIGIGLEISLDTQDVIALNLKTGQVFDLEGLLHKDLFRPANNQESQVMQLTKVYPWISVLINKNRRFEDMKKIAGILEEISFGPSGNYAVSEEQAKALLERELQELQDFYDHGTRYMFAWGGNIHIFRGDVVKRLARELLGDEVLEPLEELDVDEYVKFLVSKGYTPGQFETEGTLPLYSVKERHLLEFYKQVYRQDPAKAAKLYRKDYLNTRPSTTIDAEVREDGSNIQRLCIAPGARIFSLKIEHWVHSPGYNDFNFYRTTPNSEDARFWLRTNLYGSALLPLQEWACDRVGISFAK